MTLALLLVTALWRVRTEQVDSLTERELAATHLLALASDAYFGRQLARVEGIAAGLEGDDPADPTLRPVLMQAMSVTTTGSAPASSTTRAGPRWRSHRSARP